MARPSAFDVRKFHKSQKNYQAMFCHNKILKKLLRLFVGAFLFIFEAKHLFLHI